MSALTLPGGIPGLLRRGSPVVIRLGSDVAVSGVIVLPGYAVYRNGGAEGSWEYGAHTGTLTDDLLDGDEESTALDLTDATGRAHAAWWLDAACDRAGTWAGAHMWHLRVELDGVRRFGPWTSEPRGYCCFALAEIDPADLRLLPDGSRWVDAEALRRVVLHVAGVAP